MLSLTGRLTVLTQTVSVPLPLLKRLCKHFAKIEEILATLEELRDKNGLRRIEKGLKEYRKEQSVTAKSQKGIRETLMKD